MPYLIDDSKVAGGDYVEYIINCIKKEVKQDDSLVRQILYTVLSAYSNDPINLGIMAPTSEGKTYPVTKVMKYAPPDDVWLIGAMSPKTLVRQNGILVDKDNQPAKPKLKDLDRKIKDAEKSSGQNNKNEFLEERQQLIENCKYMIDLRGKILVFLEPPNHELWNILKPILSHDSPRIEYPFVDRNDSLGIHARNFVVQGFPACIFCTAKDESKWSEWDQITSRFLIVSPNMDKTKYQQSNLLIGIKNGLPTSIQQQLIISPSEVQNARECFNYLKDEIRELSKPPTENIETEWNPIFIPYCEYLADALPSDKGIDVRIAKKIFGFLNVIALAKAHLRPKILTGIDRYTIAELSDLKEALSITISTNNIPAYKFKFFKDVFYPTYDSKYGPDENKEEQEKIKAVTTKELCASHKTKYNKPINTDSLKKTYLDELLNNGFIDSEPSILDKRQLIYYPIVEPQDYSDDKEFLKLSKSKSFDNFSQISRIRIPNNCRQIPKDWLIYTILGFANYRIDWSRFAGCIADELNEGSSLIIIDRHGNRMKVKEFTDEYERDCQLSQFFYKPHYSSKVFGEIKYLGVSYGSDEDSGSTEDLPSLLKEDKFSALPDRLDDKDDSSGIKDKTSLSRSSPLAESFQDTSKTVLDENQHNEIPSLNNQLRSSSNLSNKKEPEKQEIDRHFKCHYCDEFLIDDKERCYHIDFEHSGKMHYPNPEDFQNRLIK